MENMCRMISSASGQVGYQKDSERFWNVVAAVSTPVTPERHYSTVFIFIPCDTKMQIQSELCEGSEGDSEFIIRLKLAPMLKTYKLAVM